MAAPNLKPPQDRHARDRAIMVSRHLAVRGISDPLVLAAMGTVPREAFVPEELADFAYEDFGAADRGRRRPSRSLISSPA